MSKEKIIVADGEVVKEAEKKTGVDMSQFQKDSVKKKDVSTADIDSFLGESYVKKGTIDMTSEDEVTGSKSTRPRTRKTKKKEMFVSGEVLSGAMIITLIDLMIPSLIVTANNTLDKKGKKVNVRDLRLNATQKKELEPIAEELARHLEVKANPAVIMILSLISIYGLNFAEAKYSL